MFKKLKTKIKTAFIAFFYGLKNTEDDVLGQKLNSLSESNSIHQKMQMNELADALLKGEVTQEVEMLRDRTYWVADESKKFKVVIDTVGTSKALKKMGKKNPPKLLNNLEGFEIKLIMDNSPIPTSVLQGLNAVGSYGIPDEYPLLFEYETPPKYKLQSYVKKLVLRSNGEVNLLDLYVPKFIDSIERMEKIFDNEINKVKDKMFKPINLEFKSVGFISNNTWGAEDLYEFKFEFVKFIDISEFDGKNVLTYEVNVLNSDNPKITDKYKNEKLRNSYANKESRNTTLKLTDNVEKHKCDRCGKFVEDNYDYRVTKETIGVGVCRKCLNEINEKATKGLK